MGVLQPGAPSPQARSLARKGAFPSASPETGKYRLFGVLCPPFIPEAGIWANLSSSEPQHPYLAPGRLTAGVDLEPGPWVRDSVLQGSWA